MFQYLVILLDDCSVSYCHYDKVPGRSRLMPLDVLREGIMYGMKHNLMIQFVYPDYGLPEEYVRLIDSIDHINIKSCDCAWDGSAVIVYDNADRLALDGQDCPGTVVLRLAKDNLFDQDIVIESLFDKVGRLNLIITDVDSFDRNDFERYRKILTAWCKTLTVLYANGLRPQVNVLTDRLMLDGMNNCGAGDSSLTLAPDGRFYACPAFYLAGDELKAHHLYKLKYAPICRECDAYHCKRCVWLNHRQTCEVNTPGRQQCIVSHIERNASRELLGMLQRSTSLFAAKEIGEIDYLDPLDRLLRKKR